jgi:hypothetical protein
MRDPVSMYSRVPTSSSEDGGAAATAASPRASDAALAPPLAAVPAAPAEPAAPAGALQPVYVVAGFIVGVLLLVGSLAALLIPASGPGLLYAFVGFAGAQLVLVSTRAVRAGACAGVDMHARCCRRRCCCCCARAAAATPSDDDGSGGGADADAWLAAMADGTDADVDVEVVSRAGVRSVRVPVQHLRLMLHAGAFPPEAFDALSALDDGAAADRLGAARAPASEAEVDALPLHVHGSGGKAAAGEASGGAQSCVVCLDAFAKGDVLRSLPCLHLFHQFCVDKWLESHEATCPICKLSIRDPLFRV